MKPPLAPLAAGCMAESGSRLPQSRDFVAKLDQPARRAFLSPAIGGATASLCLLARHRPHPQNCR